MLLMIVGNVLPSPGSFCKFFPPSSFLGLPLLRHQNVTTALLLFVKSTESKRIKRQLRVLNFLAAAALSLKESLPNELPLTSIVSTTPPWEPLP